MRKVALLSLASLFALFSVTASAQYSKPVCSNGKNTTTVSGIVYSPNGQDPLPDVLVYVPGSAGPVAIPDGVTTVDLRPQSPLSQSTTAYDGSFTLSDAPAGTSVPLVIQSGKWQRQLVISAVAACQDNIPPDPAGDKFARFPRNKSEGYIPRIGIITGSKESTECVLRKVGMDDTEFTNFSGGGRINLYLGGQSAGSKIDSNTPGELALMNDSTELNAFDLLLFPCQGSDQPTSSAGITNLASFANSGGRIFINHHSHAWLKTNSAFANTFNWGSDGASANAGPATVDQTFTIGATLASWLQNLRQTTTQGQVAVTNVFASLASITTNAQLWISLNSNTLPIQASFDTPVGATAGNSYGRVLYNEYHVSPASSNGTTFPAECTSSTMSQQEKILEFSLFDLSSFAAIVKVDPDMTLTGSPNPAKFGASITMTATLAVPSGSSYSIPTGAVTFSEGATSYGTAVLKAGIATTSLNGLSAGAHTITAAYAGDPYYNARTVTTTVTVYPAATVSVVANPNPVYTGHGSTITFTATSSSAAPTPTGTVAITIDGTTATYTLSSGTATVPSHIYTNGAHPITAVYSGDSNYDTQSASTTLYVQVQSSSSLVEGAPSVFLLNPAVFTATANGTADVIPSGTMTFSEGSTVLGVVSMANGSASLSLSTLSFGRHTVTAAYSGDNYYGPSSTLSVVEDVMDYQLSIASTSGSIPHSTTATYTFTFTPLGGSVMPSDISLAITNLRPGSTVTFSPSGVAAGSGVVTVTATIKTADGPSVPPDLLTISLIEKRANLFVAGMLFAPLLFRSHKRLRRSAVLLGVLLALSVGLGGCGTGWKTLTYGMQLTTASGALSHNSELTLTEVGGK